MADNKIFVVKNIKQYRIELNKNVEDIAHALGVEESTVRGYESEADIIPMKRLITIANIFGVSLDYLFGIEKENTYYTKIEITLKDLGTNLRNLRKKNQKTLMELEKNTKISHSSLSRYECGKTLIKTSYLYSLIKEYERFSVDTLFNRKQIDKKNNMSKHI